MATKNVIDSIIAEYSGDIDLCYDVHLVKESDTRITVYCNVYGEVAHDGTMYFGKKGIAYVGSLNCATDRTISLTLGGIEVFRSKRYHPTEKCVSIARALQPMIADYYHNVVAKKYEFFERYGMFYNKTPTTTLHTRFNEDDLDSIPERANPDDE